MDPILTLPDLPPAPDSSLPDNAPRFPLSHCLPDGTPLHLTAGILVDLAAIYQDEADAFAAYIPSRHDEFATLLWMASRPREHCGAAWREGSPPLIASFPALRATVSRWVDETFRPSEADLVRSIALDLWVAANKTRTVITEKKAPAAAETAAASSITPTSSPNTSTPSPEGTS